METPQNVDCLFVFEAGSINTVIKEHTGPIYNGDPKVKAVKVEEGEEKTVAALSGIFYSDTREATEFLAAIKGMKPSEVTAMVRRYVEEKKISEMSSHRDLWAILNANGYYDASESNWNKALR